MTFDPSFSGLLMKCSRKSAPTSTRTPPISCPSVNGHGSCLGQCPLRMCRSVPQTPQAPILMSAALLGMSGQGTVRITGAAPGPSKVETRICSIARRLPPSRAWSDQFIDRVVTEAILDGPPCQYPPVAQRRFAAVQQYGSDPG